jgi:4-hydroxybenzoate polyprenyltransferase
MSVNEAWALLSAVALIGLVLVWFVGRPLEDVCSSS